MYFLLSVWHSEETSHSQLKWHTHSPIFHNFSLLNGGVLFSFPQCSDKGIHILTVIIEDNNLRMFNDLCSVYDLSLLFSFTCNFDLPWVHGVHWCQPLYIHEPHDLLDVMGQTGGLDLNFIPFFWNPLADLLLSIRCGKGI